MLPPLLAECRNQAVQGVALPMALRIAQQQEPQVQGAAGLAVQAVDLRGTHAAYDALNILRFAACDVSRLLDESCVAQTFWNIAGHMPTCLPSGAYHPHSGLVLENTCPDPNHTLRAVHHQVQSASISQVTWGLTHEHVLQSSIQQAGRWNCLSQNSRFAACAAWHCPHR